MFTEPQPDGEMEEYGVKHIVFSSTQPPMESLKEPLSWKVTGPCPNPYGETKLAIEKMLRWCDAAGGIKSISLRYFNAAGAHKSGDIEDHRPESHLIPIIMEAALGKRDSIHIFGDDYDTGWNLYKGLYSYFRSG